MAWDDLVLEKRWFRSDAIWARSALYRWAALRRLPFTLDTRALLRSQYWDRARIKRYQDRRIAQMLRRAAQLPLWREQFDAIRLDTTGTLGRESLRALPILTKTTFTNTDETTYVNARFKASSLPDQTSGSTGRPFSFYHNLGYVLRSYAIVERMLRTAGDGVRYPLIIVRRGQRMGFSFLKADFFYLESYSVLKHRIDELLALIKRRGRVTLFLWGSVAIEFARLLKEWGTKPDIGGLIVTGEAITPEDRADIEAALGARVTISYAGSDIGRIAFQCPHQRLHLNEEWAYVEIVDGEGAVLPSGARGRIVVSVFENDVMPFIRYDTGDQGTISEEPCPCGRTLRTLELSGRDIHILTFPDGYSVSVLDIKARFDRLSHALEEYQIVRNASYNFTIRVVPGSAFAAERDRIAEAVARQLHPHATVRWEEVAHIAPLPSGKASYFIDLTTRHA